MCGQGCGECYSVTGPAGTATFIVNEVADINAIGISGQGINFNLYSGGSAPNRKVMNYNGPTHVAVQKVPCPVTGCVDASSLVEPPSLMCAQATWCWACTALARLHWTAATAN